MHADMTAVTIQSNKFVSNEVKDKYVLLQPSYRKKPMNFLATPIYMPLGICSGCWSLGKLCWMRLSRLGGSLILSSGHIPGKTHNVVHHFYPRISFPGLDRTAPCCHPSQAPFFVTADATAGWCTPLGGREQGCSLESGSELSLNLP